MTRGQHDQHVVDYWIYRLKNTKPQGIVYALYVSKLLAREPRYPTLAVVLTCGGIQEDEKK